MSSALLSLNPVRVPATTRASKQAIHPARGRNLTVRTMAANWGTVKGQGDTKKKDSAWLTGHADSTRSIFTKLEEDYNLPQAPRFIAVVVAGAVLLALLNAAT